MSARENVSQHRRDVHSAMYWLVWHAGMKYEQAERFLILSEGELIAPLAELGREHGNRCFAALSRYIDKVTKP